MGRFEGGRPGIYMRKLCGSPCEDEFAASDMSFYIGFPRVFRCRRYELLHELPHELPRISLRMSLSMVFHCMIIIIT